LKKHQEDKKIWEKITAGITHANNRLQAEKLKELLTKSM